MVCGSGMRGAPALGVALVLLLAACGGARGSSSTTASTGVSSSSVQPSSSARTPAATALPSDPCSLITDAEALTVMSGTLKKEPVPQQSASGIVSTGCSWNTDLDQLNVTLLSGVPVAQVRLAFETESKESNGRSVPGLGDFAVVLSNVNVGADVKLIVRDIAVTVGLIGTGASQKQEALVAVAKGIASRLG